jgi:signal transduction histidine kinase
LKKYSQELKELNASKDKLFSIIAHDLRSPFNPLLGLTEIIISDFDSLSKEELIDYNQEIYKLVRNEYILLENLLSWSRFESGKMKFSPEKINLYEKTGSVINLLLETAKFKNITLLNETDKDIFVSADPNMLYSVLQNLIANAIKFTNKGGTIETYSEKNGNEFIRITISDNGVGMTDDQTKNLFGYTTVSTKGTNDEKGTGLGLMICKDMVERHGGTICVHSVPGKGTDISFILPKAE